jgi:hypothetical protein
LYSPDDAGAQARAAFGRLTAEIDAPDQRRIVPVLIVLDMSKYNAFSALYAAAPRQSNDGLMKSPDGYGLLMVEGGRLEGMLVGGVQFSAREGFEVVGIGCNLPIQDNQPAKDLVSAVRAAEGLPVLPWAFGKWIGARGREVRHLLDGDDGGDMMLGDNALRPQPCLMPSQFGAARERNIPVLPGSDPLPLAGDHSRTGTYGFSFDGQVSSAKPVSSFMQQLAGLHTQPHIVGRRLGWIGALLAQFRIRVEDPVAKPRKAAQEI